jgi:hypothetical protein
MPPSVSDESPTPTLAGSPASFAESDPLTPSWDFSFPEPEILDSESHGGPGGSGFAGRFFTVGGDLRRHVLTKGIDAVIGLEQGQAVVGLDKGKGRATEDFQANTIAHTDASAIPSMVLDQAHTAGDGNVTGTQTHGTAIQCRPPTIVSPTALPRSQEHVRLALPRHPLPYGLPPYASSSLAQPTSSGKSASLVSKNREDILRRARMMRAQITQEIERAKVELWETTMESGCLTVLAKERVKLA